MRLSRRFSILVSAPAWLTLFLFFVAPLLYFLRYSFDEHSLSEVAISSFTLQNFTKFFGDPYYRSVFERTMVIAAVSTVITAILAFPPAYLLAKAKGTLKSMLIIVTVFPLLAGDVVRAIGWVALLGYAGPVSKLLVWMHLSTEPHDLARTSWAVTIAIISVVLPINILVYQASLEAVDPATERAALDLGASPYTVLWKVVIPQIGTALITGTSLVFVLCINAFGTPMLVGAGHVQMMAPEMYTIITNNNDWPLGAAMAAVLLVTTIVITILYGWLLRRRLESWRIAQ